MLGRSEDKQIGLNDDPFRVKSVLRERYLRKRNSSSGLGVELNELDPSSRRLTVGAVGKTRIASNKSDVINDYQV